MSPAGPADPTGPAPARRARSPQARGDETRRRILDETVACVLEEGAAAASASRVAARAEVTWGVIQYHFGTRDGLLRAVVEDGLDGLGGALDGIIDGDTCVSVAAVVERAWAAFSRPASLAALEILVSARTSSADGVSAGLADLEKRMSTMGAELATILGSRPAVGLLWTCLRGMALVRMVSPGPHEVERELRLVTTAVSALVDQAAAGTAAAPRQTP